MDKRDLELRNRTYGLLVELGRPPLAREAGLVEEVRAGWRRLHEAHALVLDESGHEILMANPFSAVPTRFRVHADERWWFGNCAWDALGICAALASDGRIETDCPDCSAAISLEVQRGEPSDDSLFFHCLVPAAHWWDDIVFT